MVGVIVQLGGQTPLGLAQRLADDGCADRRHRRRRPSIWPRTAARSARCSSRGRAARAALRHGHHASRRPAASPPTSATRCWSGRPTCSAGAAWRSSTTTRRCRATSPAPPSSRPSIRCWWTASSRTPSRSTSTRSATATEVYIGGIMEHIEEAGIHSGDSACALPPVTLGRSDIEKVRTRHRGDRARHRRDRPAQRAVRAEGRRAVRPGGQSAGQPHRAVRLEGHRDTAGQGVRADHAGRHDCRAPRGGPAGGRPATAATRRPTRRSPSRKPCCRSTGSARPTARGSTRCSARR